MSFETKDESETDVMKSKQLGDVPIKDPARSHGYYFVKNCIFAPALNLFYNDIEIVGRANFPREGPVIVALNHANSLVDAAVALTSCPRNVRMTCKDNLFDDWFWAPLIRGVDAIGVKRRRDYNNAKCDNSEAFKKLFDEISKGCCVGMFPEGIGRYKPYLSPLKTGLARIAVDYVIEQHLKDTCEYDYIYIQPVGITYLHREMFRSNVSVRIGEPIRVDYDFITKTVGMRDFDSSNLLSNDEKFHVSKYITKMLSTRMFNLVISVPDWHTIVLSHLARQMAFPESSQARYGSYLVDYVDVTRQFSVVFVDNKLKMSKFVKKQELDKLNSDIMSEDSNGLSLLKQASAESAASQDSNIDKKGVDAEMKEREDEVMKLGDEDEVVNECYKWLKLYFEALRRVGLKDWRILELSGYVKNVENGRQSNVNVRISILLRIWFRLTVAVIYALLGLPGVIMFMPITLSWRLAKRYWMKMGAELNYDNVAQTKMFIGYFGTLPLILLEAVGVYRMFGGFALKLFLLLSPILLWLAARSFEDGTASLRSFVSLCRMFKLTFSSKKLNELITIREKTSMIVDKVVNMFNIRYETNLLDTKTDIYNDTKSWSNWLRRKVTGRQKRDWNETLRLYDVASDELHLSPRLAKYIQTPDDSVFMHVDSKGNISSARPTEIEKFNEAAYTRLN